MENITIDKQTIEIKINPQTGAVTFRQAIRTFEGENLISETRDYITSISPENSNRNEVVLQYANQDLLDYLQSIWS